MIWESIFFINEQVGFMGLRFERVLKTTDGGDTWDKIYEESDGFFEHNIEDAYYFDETTGVALQTGFATAKVMRNNNIEKSEGSGIAPRQSNHAEFGLYPNPAGDQVIITPEKNLKGTGQIQVYNATGTVIRQNNELALNQHQTLNVSNWEAGVYWIAITQNDETHTQKLIVE